MHYTGLPLRALSRRRRIRLRIPRNLRFSRRLRIEPLESRSLLTAVAADDFFVSLPTDDVMLDVLDNDFSDSMVGARPLTITGVTINQVVPDDLEVEAVPAAIPSESFGNSRIRVTLPNGSAAGRIELAYQVTDNTSVPNQATANVILIFNTRPQLAEGEYQLDPIHVIPSSGEPINNIGTLVSDLITDAIHDPDDGEFAGPRGIAVMFIDPSISAQYSLDGGEGWHDFGEVSDSSATLLAADESTRIRIIPHFSALFEPVTLPEVIGFRAWDQSQGANGETDFGATAEGEEAPVSASSVLASVRVLPGASNHAPEFTKGADQFVSNAAGPQTILHWATNISTGAGDFTEQILTFLVSTDNDSLFSELPAISEDGTLTYTPSMDATGTAVVTVRLQDDGGIENGGEDTSPPQTFLITTFSGELVPPVASDDPEVITFEDQPFFFNVLFNDEDPDGSIDPTTVEIVDHPEFGQISVDPLTGIIGYEPMTDFFGLVTFTYRVRDNEGLMSNIATVTVSVLPVNDPPRFLIDDDDSTFADTGERVRVGFARNIAPGPPNESSQLVHFLVTNDNNSLFEVQPEISPDGTLTYTPAAGATGQATVTVRLRDDGGGFVDEMPGGNRDDTSDPQTFTITVLPAEEEGPSFTIGPDQTVNEDASPQTVSGFATNISPGSFGGEFSVLVFVVTNDNNDLFAVQPAISADGTLTYTLAPNAHGTATVTAQLLVSNPVVIFALDLDVLPENNLTSPPQSFTITVNSVNDAPSFVIGPNQAVSSNAGPQTVSGFATAISPGPADESSQSLTFHVSIDNDSLFEVPPAISPDGTLTYTPAPQASGAATVTVRIKDDGGLENGGIDASESQTFNISVSRDEAPAPVANDDPENVTLEDQSMNVDVLANDTDTQGSIDPASVQITQAPQFGTVLVDSTTGRIGYRPNPDFFGTDTFRYTVKNLDGQESNAALVTINVTPVNDAPLFVVGSSPSAGDDAGPQTIVGFISGIMSGPANELGQSSSFLVTTENPELFSILPAISADGTLTYAPAPAASGVAAVTVTLQDDGGTQEGGVDTSAPQRFSIAIMESSVLAILLKEARRIASFMAGPSQNPPIPSGVVQQSRLAATRAFVITDGSTPGLSQTLLDPRFQIVSVLPTGNQETAARALLDVSRTGAIDGLLAPATFGANELHAGTLQHALVNASPEQDGTFVTLWFDPVNWNVVTPQGEIHFDAQKGVTLNTLVGSVVAAIDQPRGTQVVYIPGGSFAGFQIQLDGVPNQPGFHAGVNLYGKTNGEVRPIFSSSFQGNLVLGDRVSLIFDPSIAVRDAVSPFAVFVALADSADPAAANRGQSVSPLINRPTDASREARPRGPAVLLAGRVASSQLQKLPPDLVDLLNREFPDSLMPEDWDRVDLMFDMVEGVLGAWVGSLKQNAVKWLEARDGKGSTSGARQVNRPVVPKASEMPAAEERREPGTEAIDQTPVEEAHTSTETMPDQRPAM